MRVYLLDGSPLTTGQPSWGSRMEDHDIIQLVRWGEARGVKRREVPFAAIVVDTIGQPLRAGDARAIRMLLRHGHLIGIWSRDLETASAVASGLSAMMRATA